MTSPERKLLFIGATGMLGRPVAKAFIERGCSLRVLARDPAKAQNLLGPDVEVVSGDVLQAKDVERALAGCNGVYLNLISGNSYEYEKSTELNGLKNVLLAAASQPLDWLGYISGSGDFEKYEHLPPLRIKLAAERMIEASGIPHVIFKPTHFMESLDLFVQRGKPTILGNQPHKLHYLAAEDYAQLVVDRYLAADGRNHKIVCLGPEAYTMKEALEIYSRHLLGGAKVGTIPLWVCGLIGTLSGNDQMKTARVLFSAFQQVEEAPPSGTEFEQWMGSTTLEQWCLQRKQEQSAA